MAIIRKERKTEDSRDCRLITNIVSHDMKCDFLCEQCERFFDCERPEKERVYSRRRMSNARRALQNIGYKILVAGGKGGVGKSTCSANLAMVLAMMGYRVTILDQDLDGSSIPKMLGVTEKRMKIGENGLIPVEAAMGLQVVAVANLKEASEAVVWFHDMRRNASEEFICHTDYGQRDFLIVDLPPGTSSEAVSTVQLIPDADGYVIVTAASRVSQATARKALLFAKKADKRILGVIENMSGYVCEQCGTPDELLPLGGGFDLAREQDVPFLGRIPLDPSLARSCDEGRPLVESLRESVTARIIERILLTVMVQLSTPRQYTFSDTEELGRLAAADKAGLLGRLAPEGATALQAGRAPAPGAGAG